jgi:hypothetical protein
MYFYKIVAWKMRKLIFIAFLGELTGAREEGEAVVVIPLLTPASSGI